MAVWKRSHIDLVMNLKKQGKGNGEIAEALGKRFGIKKSSNAVSCAFERYKHEYDLKSLKTTVEVKAELMEAKCLQEFLKMVEKRKYIPVVTEFERHTGIATETVARYFGNLDGLVEAAKKEDPKVFENVIDSSTFTDENFKELRKKIAKYRRFVVTAAVTNCEPHMDALRAVETYCKENDAFLLILPCSDPARQKDRKDKWSLDPKLPKESIVFRDVALNDNIMLSTIKITAKQIQPLTGLKRIAQMNGSAIFAATKQFGEYVTNSNNNTEIPRLLATTGAITVAEYVTEMYMSERLAYMATKDHNLGGMIIEIEDDRIFYARPFQFEPKTGAFCDFDKKYHANGKVEKVTAELIGAGDWHTMSTDPKARQMTKSLVELMKPDYLTLEDFLDGITINPHERDNLIALSKKAKMGLLSLNFEFQANQKEIDDICTWSVQKKVIFKYGNHEDFLKRWISDGQFIKEPQNKTLGEKLDIAIDELDVMPFEYAMRELYGLKYPDRVRFLKLNDSFKVNGIENGAHGHLGKGGRRNPGMAEVEECYGASNVGHNHSASWFRSVYRVGTNSLLKLSYNDGPSAWTQSDVIQHRNGTRQMITLIYGKYRLED